jgi:hypothetical protein
MLACSAHPGGYHKYVERHYPKIKKPSYSTIDIKSTGDEETSFEKVFEIVANKFHGCWSSRHGAG